MSWRRERLFSRLSPARLFIQADAQCGFAHDFMGKEGIRGMYAAQPRVADETFVSRGTEDARAAGNIQPNINHPPCSLDGVVFGGEDLRRPFGTVVNAIRPVIRDPFYMRPDRFKLNHHLRDSVLDLGMVSHRPRQSERVLALCGGNALAQS